MSFGPPPKGYIPGLGRGASGFTTRSDIGPAGSIGETSGSRSSGLRQQHQQQQQQQDGDNNGDAYDEDDQEADDIYAAIDERMKKRRRKNGTESQKQDVVNPTRAKIGAQFRDLKEQLGQVTEAEWANIPDSSGDYTLKYKQKKTFAQQDSFISDSMLASRVVQNTDASAGNKVAAATAPDASSGFMSVNVSGLAQARGTLLGMSLDKMSDAGRQTSIDAQGYLTSLSTTTGNGTSTINPSAQVADIQKARLLLKSVRDTNPNHAPGWIASARVEEAAGKILQARKIIQEACQVCPTNTDVWLEAARLFPPPEAKRILATAARKNLATSSVPIFVKAAELEAHTDAKKAVFRKALEAHPTSVTLWKAAIALETSSEHAKLLLSVAVEQVPHSVEMWLALARLETYENARRVLNKARRALPTERSIWIAAAKLEESQNHASVVDKILLKAVQSLNSHDAIVTRSQWLEEAHKAELAGAPKTSAAIIQHTVGLGVDAEDRTRTWAEDAKAMLAKGAIATARSILALALVEFPRKRTLWVQAIDLERQHGTRESLDQVLARASEQLPSVEIFWLVRAKEQWLGGNVDRAREILTDAFAANPNSEAVWLAAAKLEWENEEIERARVLLQRARERAPTARVYMKSALLEREQGNWTEALELIQQGLAKYPQFAKFYMMAGQILSSNVENTKENLDKARKYYQKGLQNCPESAVLWILTSRLEERAYTFQGMKKATPAAGITKARSILELARLKNPKNPELWLEAIRLERHRAQNAPLANALMARALQECPKSGRLLAENIATAPRVDKKSKSADAIERCPQDAHVIAEVASLFVMDRKYDKARKWFEKAVNLNPDLGDTWAKLYALELGHGTKDQQGAVKERCVKAEPKHGEVWTRIIKDMANRKKTVGEGLELVAKAIRQEQQQQQSNKK